MNICTKFPSRRSRNRRRLSSAPKKTHGGAKVMTQAEMASGHVAAAIRDQSQLKYGK